VFILQMRTNVPNEGKSRIVEGGGSDGKRNKKRETKPEASPGDLAGYQPLLPADVGACDKFRIQGKSGYQQGDCPGAPSTPHIGNRKT